MSTNALNLGSSARPMYGRSSILLFRKSFFTPIAFLLVVLSPLSIASGPVAIETSTLEIQATQQPPKVILITLRPNGFEPKLLSIPQGKFILALDNRSGVVKDELNFRLDGVAGVRIREVRFPKGKRGWREVVDLSTGVYLLSEASHPLWTCTITIIAR